MDEFDFWGHQITEHALFVALSLQDAALRKRAMDLHTALGQAYAACDLQTFLAHLSEFMTFKREGLALVKGGTWIGWGFPSMLRHMLDEEQFFVDKINGNITPQQEIAFWLKERLEENELAAHLIDPTEGVAITKLINGANQFARLGQQCLAQCDVNVIRGAGLAGQAMNAELARMRPQSVIPPQLQAHVEREGARFVQATQRILHAGR